MTFSEIVNIGTLEFPVEIIDEAAGEVLIFDDAELLEAFEQAEFEGRDYDHPNIRRRVMELRDQLITITGEIEQLLLAA